MWALFQKSNKIERKIKIGCNIYDVKDAGFMSPLAFECGIEMNGVNDYFKYILNPINILIF